MWRGAACLLAILPLAGQAAAPAGAYVSVPAGTFRSALRYEDVAAAGAKIAPFRLMRRPVTNGDFLRFVLAHPEWQRGRAPVALAEPRYLSQWAGAVDLGGALPDQPVTWVSWFAADAYCAAESGRLPTWNEWEYVAAADDTRRDARADPAWRERILSWYAEPSTGPLPAVGRGAPNAYGIQDLHGLVWEWVDDASALLVSSDNREQGAADKLRFCGAAALSTDDRENYAILMRVALLSSVEAADATANLGFRCAKDVP
jgi:formylglycine-generating enzyme required for sulfatase activity